MAAPQREGSHRGQVIAIGLSETKDNHLAQVGIRASLTQWYDQQQKQWCDITAEACECEAYLMLEGKDGGILDFNVRALREAFGWNGDILKLNDDSFVGAECQMFIGWNDYQGTRSLKGKSIKAYDAEPVQGVRKVDESSARTIVNRLGPKVRAVIGAPAARPAGVPARPASAPMSSPAAVALAPPPPARRMEPTYSGETTDDLPF